MRKAAIVLTIFVTVLPSVNAIQISTAWPAGPVRSGPQWVDHRLKPKTAVHQLGPAKA